MIIKVSIILPTYNGGKYIKRAIESVISQSFSYWELLVIDDGSTDDTESIVREYQQKDSRIIYLKNTENLGIQKTLNIGLKVSKGEYIARIDDDDYWIDNSKLEKQVRFLDFNPEYVLVGTLAVFVDEKEKELLRPVYPETDQEIRKKIIFINFFFHASVMFKKDIIMKIGGYSEAKSSTYVDDYDLWFKIGLLGHIYILPSYMIAYTIRNNSICSKNKRSQYFKALILSYKNKDNYPNYRHFLFRSLARFIVYGFLLKKPISFYFNKIKNYLKYYYE